MAKNLFAKLIIQRVGDDIVSKGKAPFKKGDMVRYITDPEVDGDVDVTRGHVYEVVKCEHHGIQDLGLWYVTVLDDIGERNMLYGHRVMLDEPAPPTEAGAREYDEIMQLAELLPRRK